MAKILLVEDDLDFQELLVKQLTNERHSVEALADGAQAWDYLIRYEYDLIILDWHLPQISGVELCQRYRDKGRTTPILMLTARAAIAEKEQGLDAGADDYLTKPFHPRELGARLRALLRRGAGVPKNRLKAGTLEVDSTNYKVWRNGTELKLQPKEFAVLEFMMRHPNEIFSSDALLDRVWKSTADVSTETVRQVITRLRQKIGTADDGVCISTTHGVGYRLEVP
jgi:DNA-binding response OmpR family regulator